MTAVVTPRPRPDAPCKKCEKRYPGCHPDCETFQSFRKEYDAWQHEIRAKEGAETFIKIHVSRRRLDSIDQYVRWGDFKGKMR